MPWAGMPPVIAPMYGGAMVVGLKVIARMPPMRPRMKPMKNPPIEVIQLTMERMRMMTPHIVWDDGLELIMIPPTIMMSPMIHPTIPRTRTPLPTPLPGVVPVPVPVKLKVEIIDPTKARNRPPSITNIPPRIDRTIAAVGFSPIVIG